MSKGEQIGERDWGKRPLFASRRRHYLRWLLLLLGVVVAVALFLFPNIVQALLVPLFG